VKKKAFVAAALVLASGAAHAQLARPGFYAGLDVGGSRSAMRDVEINAALSAQGVNGGATSIAQTGHVYGVNAGYRYNEHWSMEAAWHSLGSFDYSSVTATDKIVGLWEARALSISGMYSYPLSRALSLYGKAGAAATTVNLNATSTTGATTVGNKSHTNLTPLVGVGMTFALGTNWFGKAGWDHYSTVGDGTTGSQRLEAYVIGVGMRF